MTQLRIFTAVSLVVVLLAGCAVVSTRTTKVGPNEIACNSAGGDYGLALSKLQIQVREERDPDFPAAGRPETTTIASGVSHKVYRDDRASFCLEFLTSFTSADKLIVEKAADTGLLKKVTVNAEDQLPAVIQTATNQIATGGLRTSDNQLPPLRFDDEFNPLVPADLSILNSRLRDFGFCVVVRKRDSDALSLKTLVQHNCNRTISRAEQANLVRTADALPPALTNLSEEYRNAILYRPTISIDVYLMSQPNRSVPNDWVIYEKRVFSVIDPETIHAVDIRRAVFADRKTELEFEGGVLTTVLVDKGSEAAGFVGIPLNILRAIFALPTEIIAIRIGETNEMQELIRAQTELAVAQATLDARQQELADQRALAETRNALSVGLRSGDVSLPQCVATCRSGGRDLTSCETSCQCLATSCAVGDIACQNACF